MWGCQAEVRIYNPHEKKLDSRTISGYFIGYPEHSKGYKFYSPRRGNRIVESLTTKFLELDVADAESSQDDDVDKTQAKTISIPVSVHDDDDVPDQVEEMDIHVLNPSVSIENLQHVEPVEELPLRRSTR